LALETALPVAHDGTVPPAAQRVREILRLLVKAQKALRLYQTGNAVSERLQAELFSTLSTHLDDFGSFTLTVREFRILLGGEAVYEGTDRNDSLAFLLFRDGIRQLTFGPGLTPNELHRFLTCLNRVAVLANEQDDLVTLFWEEDFKAITVYAARTLFPLIEQDRSIPDRIFTAVQHHLGFDGKGYPKLRIRRRQTLYARITAIADTFDAMTTKRIHQGRFLPDEAMEVLLKNAGTHYDEGLVKAFINCMGVFPVGSTVVLKTGEIAVVVESNPDPDHVHQPKVKVVMNARRQWTDPIMVDLSQPPSSNRAIVKCVDPESFGINSAHYAI